MGAANDHLSNELVVAVYESLFRYWKGKGFRRAEAEDLAQEGLCKAIEAAGAWERKAKLKTFLISVGKNRGIDPSVATWSISTGARCWRCPSGHRECSDRRVPDPRRKGGRLQPEKALCAGNALSYRMARDRFNLRE